MTSSRRAVEAFQQNLLFIFRALRILRKADEFYNTCDDKKMNKMFGNIFIY